MAPLQGAHLSDAGPRHSWPLQKGFERYYGILDGFTNFHQPHRLYEDNHHIPVDQYPDDYYFTDDLTDQAIHMIDEVRASHPTKPFFMYFAHGPSMRRCRRRSTTSRSTAACTTLAGTRSVGSATSVNSRWGSFRLTPNFRPQYRGGHAVEAWDNLSDDERQIFARYMEIFAGMVDNIDQNLGRLRAHLEAMGEWDNTIIVFTSDNGGSREGQELGTSAYFRTLVSQTRQNSLDSVDLDLPNLGAMGGPTNLPHYPMGWAMVSSTPFRLYKINTHQGGHQVPFIVHWPAGLSAAGEVRTSTSTSPICCRRSPNSAGSRCRRPRAAVRYPNRPAHRWCRLSTTVASRPRIPSSTTSRSATALLSRRLVGGHLPSAP